MGIETLDGLRAFIKRETGIHLDAGKEAMMRSRLEKRVRALKLPTVEAYLEKIKIDSGQERQELVDVLTTNHTAFFRDPHHFDFLRKWLAEAKQSGKRKFRFWCAASSSGEEPYTLAMIFHEAGLGEAAFDVKILCTDLSLTILRKAREGIYNEDRIREIGPERLKQFFQKVATPLGPGYAAGAGLKSLLHFNRLNLSAMPFPMSGPFDMIFCRNVFIYFEPDLIRKILMEYARLLPLGGHLVVGSSESLTQHAGIPFKVVGNSIYQRI